jgi:hypothetical protein
MSRQIGKTDQEEECFLWLDELRNSGSINMLGARTPLKEHFGFTSNQATEVLSAWMRSFEKQEVKPDGEAA